MHRNGGSAHGPACNGARTGGSGRVSSAPTPWVCAVTAQGHARPHNEDGFWLDPDTNLWMVADGMGGRMAGEVASQLALSAAARRWVRGAPEDRTASPEAVGEALLDMMSVAHEEVRAAAQDQAARERMGTTLIVAHVAGDLLTTCHVGDVRGYVCSRRGLQRLTEDHSVVGALVRAGMITAEQARTHPRKGEVLQAIGIEPGVVPDLETLVLAEGDRVLLCSDGLWEALGQAQIEETLRESADLADVANRLIDGARAGSCGDDVTVALYEHRARAAQPPAAGGVPC